jgi:hypothetical protein
MRRVMLRLVVVSVILCARNALGIAGEDPEALIRQGIELRKTGEDARAEGYFRRAYELAVTPRTAAQLGLVELAVEDYVHAQDHLEEALGYQDAWILEHLTALKTSRDFARRHLFQIEITGAPPNATVTLEGRSPRPFRADNIFSVDPGRSATIRIEAPGRRPEILRISGAEGEVRHIALTMQALEPTPIVVSGAASPPSVIDRSTTEGASGHALRIAGVATAVVGAAAGVLGAVFYERGTTQLHEYQTAIRSNGAVRWNPQDGNWEGTRNQGVTLLIAGGVGVVGGATLFVLGIHEVHEQRAGEKVSVAVAPGAALLSYRGSF